DSVLVSDRIRSRSCPLRAPFTAPSTSHIYTLSLHDALPIFHCVFALAGVQHGSRAARRRRDERGADSCRTAALLVAGPRGPPRRSEEHTSELQSRGHLVCRPLLEKKKHFLFRTAGLTSTPSP